MYKVIAFNGSPRKNGNTEILCNNFIEGVNLISTEIEVELVHLYELSYTGCKSCFSCKRKDSDIYGKCMIKDDLYDVLNRTLKADGIIIASPIYFGDLSAQLKCFLERLLFPLSTYEKDSRTIAPKRMETALICTMNSTEQMMKERGYEASLGKIIGVIEEIFSKPEVYYCNNTYQFKNYSEYHAEIFSVKEKERQRDKQFPLDCQYAVDMGKRMAENILKKNGKEIVM